MRLGRVLRLAVHDPCSAAKYRASRLRDPVLTLEQDGTTATIFHLYSLAPPPIEVQKLLRQLLGRAFSAIRLNKPEPGI